MALLRVFSIARTTSHVTSLLEIQFKWSTRAKKNTWGKYPGVLDVTPTKDKADLTNVLAVGAKKPLRRMPDILEQTKPGITHCIVIPCLEYSISRPSVNLSTNACKRGLCYIVQPMCCGHLEVRLSMMRILYLGIKIAKALR